MSYSAELEDLAIKYDNAKELLEAGQWKSLLTLQLDTIMLTQFGVHQPAYILSAGMGELVLETNMMQLALAESIRREYGNIPHFYQEPIVSEHESEMLNNLGIDLKQSESFWPRPAHGFGVCFMIHGHPTMLTSLFENEIHDILVLGTNLESPNLLAWFRENPSTTYHYLLNQMHTYIPLEDISDFGDEEELESRWRTRNLVL